MAKVERWTGNGDKQVIHTNDPEEILRLANDTFDASKNIARVDVTDD